MAIIEQQTRTIRLALPKGRMQQGVLELLRDAGIRVDIGARALRPSISLPDCDVKLLKPQNIVEMLHLGSRDIGFAGEDWVRETKADVVELLDTGLNPVRVVVAAPEVFLDEGRLAKGRVLVATEYERLTQMWIEAQGLDAKIVRTFGATEVFPPEDADCIVDNTATGSTLQAHGLKIFDELMTSTTRLYANPKALDDPARRDIAERLTMLLRSVLEARERVMIEINITAARLDALVEILPCMRVPTISRLFGDGEYAIKAAVPRADLPDLIPRIKSCGGTDIIVSQTSQIIP
ncbi:MAG: ATP phosphoribosyltransferase [Planctomycetota bacterium]|nr:ATP phosphoribosyltransferase [Planctomycetota bacterium]